MSNSNRGKDESFQSEIKRLKQQVAEANQLNKILVKVNKQLITKNASLSIKISDAEKDKERYSLLTKNISDVIWVFNFTKKKFTFISPSIYQALGYTAEEAMQFDFTEILTDESKIKTEEIIPARLERFKSGIAEVYKDELQEKCKDGTLKWAEVLTSLRYDEEGDVEVHGVLRDISYHKQAETELTKLSTAVEQSPSVIAITDLDGYLEYVNPKFTELTGYTAEEAIGKRTSILRSGKQPDEVYKELWEIISSGKTWHGEFHNKKKNGELFWESASISPIFDKQNKIVNYLKVATDITEQKIIEEELKTALEKAQESDRLKSAFLANMSHEIRTPMHGILGFVSLLDNPDLDKEKRQQYINIIRKNGDRLLSTINDLIDVSKIRAGQMKIVKSDTLIDKQINDLYDFFKPEAMAKGLVLETRIPENKDELSIVMDATKLYSILTNLIKNAIKYTEIGKIIFGYKLNGGKIEFFVKDTGIGIPKERQKAVFNRFEQADIEDKKAREGSGLGLAIAKAYVKMLGGDISVQSAEGKGTTFSFTIPFVKSERSETIPDGEQQCKPVEDLDSDACTMLIAEDEETSALFLKIILRGKFKEILFAKNGVEAVELFKKHPEIKIVLMDIKMPEMDGHEAAKQIRALNEEVIIVAQTAHALARDKHKAFKSGFNDFITKPIHKEELLFKLNQLIQGKRSTY